MSGLTRRAVLGRGAALAAAAAAGAGGTALATGGTEWRRLDLRVERLRSDAEPPPFGSMVSAPSASATLSGELADRTGRRSGTYFSSPLGHGSVAHTLELDLGTIVAIGPLGAAQATIAGGTGSFSRAAGTITITITRSLGAGGAPRADLAVELEL